MGSVNDIGKESILSIDGEINLVTDFQHVNPGKGAAFVRTKMRNIRTGKTMDRTFKSNESVDFVQVERRKLQYLYASGEMCAFMDNSSYEQMEINESLLGDKKDYLKEGMEVMVVLHEGRPLSVELPRKVAYKVTDAPPGVKGDTAAGNVTKEVTLENNLKVQAPLFIKEGEEIIINTETGEYVERA